MSKGLVLGDVHGRFGILNYIIDKEQPEIIIQTGDFGVWTNELEGLRKIITQGTRLYFCPGNHENWTFLDKYELGKIHELVPNVFYCAFGSMLEYGELTYLFCGGADSIDKNLRTPMMDWWPSEIITERDMDALPNAKTKIDVVVSHTAPDYFDLKMQTFGNYYDPSTRLLSQVYDMYKPRRWYFSHFHESMSGSYQRCKWWMLNCVERHGGRMELPRR